MVLEWLVVEEGGTATATVGAEEEEEEEEEEVEEVEEVEEEGEEEECLAVVEGASSSKESDRVAFE